MHTPSPESAAELMTWVKGGCDLGHRGLNPSHHLACCAGRSLRKR